MRRAVTWLASFACVAVLLPAAPSGMLHAQVWDAILTIEPYPSPYYSDWDANPNIATLTLINPTADALQVRIHFNVIDQSNRMLITGSSEPEFIDAGATVIFDNPYDVAGSTTHDAEVEEVAARTGRLPEGDYTACAVAVDGSGFVLAESCAPFSIVYPDPPMLLTPFDGETLDQPDPLLQWTPVQVPIDFGVSYVLRVVEVLPGQSPGEALRENIPHFETLDGAFTSLRYPIDAQPLESGKRYAWWVQALDQNGYTASANEGRSEIWTFRYDDTPAPPTPPVTTIALSVRNDVESDAGTTGAEPTVTGLPAVCRTWESADPIDGVVYPLQSAFAFPRVLDVDATLVRDTLPESNGRRVWALYGSNDRHTVMLSGDCGVFNQETTPRWIAIRTAGDAQELHDWIPSDTAWDPSRGEADAKLKFGVAVLSAFEETVGGTTEGVRPVQEFFEGHEVEVKPGLTLFGVLDARLLGVWPVLEALGHDATTAEIELQGYAGLNSTYSAEGRLGSDQVGGGIGVTQEFLTLRAAMPERVIDTGPIRSVRTGIELSFSDSVAAGATVDPYMAETRFKESNDASLHLAAKLTVDVVTTRDITWIGALEFDFNLTEGFTEGAAPTLRLTTDHAWQPWEEVDLQLGNPELALGINDGLIAALKARDAQKLHADLTLRGSLIAFGEDLARVAVTFGRHAANDSSMSRTAARIEAAALLDSIAVARMNEATARGDTAAAASWRQKHRDHVTDMGDWKRQLRTDSAAVAAGRGGEKRATAANPDAEWYWRASLTLGNMSFMNLLDLAGNAVRAVSARQEED